MKLKTLSFLLSLLIASTAFSQNIVVPIDTRGLSNGITDSELSNEWGGVSNVTKPEMYVYLPDNHTDLSPAVLIVPGGGYEFVSMKFEGHLFARYLASQGIVAGVLKYRLPNHVHEIPLSDASQAMMYFKKHADSLGIDRGKVGVIGFSAGGHLAATLAAKGQGDARPAFSILFYPVISFTSDVTHEGSRSNLVGEDRSLWNQYSADLQVTETTPPALLFHSDDDTGVPIQNSILYVDALRNHGVGARMVVYPSGGHGWGFKSDFTYHEDMKKILVDYIKSF